MTYFIDGEITGDERATGVRFRFLPSVCMPWLGMGHRVGGRKHSGPVEAEILHRWGRRYKKESNLTNRKDIGWGRSEGGRIQTIRNPLPDGDGEII